MKKTSELETEELKVKNSNCQNICWQGCKHFNKTEEDNCPILKEVFEFGKKFGIMTPILECETFEKQ